MGGKQLHEGGGLRSVAWKKGVALCCLVVVAVVFCSCSNGFSGQKAKRGEQGSAVRSGAGHLSKQFGSRIGSQQGSTKRKPSKSAYPSQKVQRIAILPSQAVLEGKARLNTSDFGKDFKVIGVSGQMPVLPPCAVFSFPRSAPAGLTYEGMYSTSGSKPELLEVGESIRFTQSTTQATELVTDLANKKAVSCVSKQDSRQGAEPSVRARTATIKGVGRISEITEKEGLVHVDTLCFAQGEAVVELSLFSQNGPLPAAFEDMILQKVSSSLSG
jgi:hypothetical protein